MPGDPVEQGTSCYEQCDKEPTILEEQNHLTIIRQSDDKFRPMYFSRSTENDPFVLFGGTRWSA